MLNEIGSSACIDICHEHENFLRGLRLQELGRVQVEHELVEQPVRSQRQHCMDQYCKPQLDDEHSHE